jgi:hypothetical protein
MAGTVFPFGRAMPRAGGYQVSQRGVYASGCRHSTWQLATYMRIWKGRLASVLRACRTYCSFISRVPKYRSWTLGDVSDLCATGSDDVVIQDVFVAEAFAWKVAPEISRGPRYSAATFRFPFMGFFSWPMGAVALNIAQAAIDEIAGVSHYKRPRLAGGTLHEKPLS